MTDPFEDLYSPPAQVHNTAASRVQMLTLPTAAPNEPSVTTPGRAGRNDQSQSRVEKLATIPLEDWDENGSYDEDPPRCLHYSIEWKVTLNGKVISKDTETNLVLSLLPYWQQFLQPRLQQLLQKKLGNSSAKSDDTSVVVSVTGRSERDLTKRFEELDIDWSTVEKQLVQWGDLFRAGKKLRVDLTFNYVEVGEQLATNSSTRGCRKGGSSATKRMLTERAQQLDAEHDSSEQPSTWKEVYSVMRCPGPPCQLGPHCWRDPNGKKHYKLHSHHLRSLIKYVQEGSQLKSQDDVPYDIRQQLYAEEQQRRDRKSTASAPSPHGPVPITINNHFPEQSPSTLLPSRSSGLKLADKGSLIPSAAKCLDIAGPRDVAVKNYSEWQQLQVLDASLKDEVRKACSAVLEEGLDLEQVHEDQDSNFLIEKGVKRGIARRFVSDIETWAKRAKHE